MPERGTVPSSLAETKHAHDDSLESSFVEVLQQACRDIHGTNAEPEPEPEPEVEPEPAPLVKDAATSDEERALKPEQGSMLQHMPECAFDVVFSDPGELGLSLARAATGWTVVSRAIPGTQAAR